MPHAAGEVVHCAAFDEMTAVWMESGRAVFVRLTFLGATMKRWRLCGLLGFLEALGPELHSGVHALAGSCHLVRVSVPLAGVWNGRRGPGPLETKPLLFLYNKRLKPR